MGEINQTNDVNGIGLMLVTANVGSLFEDPEKLLLIWLREFIHKVSNISPKFLALHLQEVGGKTYEKSMEYVQEFIRYLCNANEMKDYVYVRIYMDEDFKSAEHFTALGNIYFAHKDLDNLRLWNFLTHEWETAEGRNIYSGNIETIGTKEKSKFPQHFFPECKWSRKGYMRTRWEICGTVIDLVNIHLFHDASNFAACEEFPSVYCKTRRRALVHTLERFHLDEKNGLVPFFIFGDFNFRCDTEGVIRELTENLTIHRVQSIKSDSTKIHYRNTTGHNVLTVGKKEFNHADHQLKFKEDWLKKFDRELEALSDVLTEYPITFAPSYPFEEDPEMPADYMSTRCPSWCDRILMSVQVSGIIVEAIAKEPEHAALYYNVIGELVCMGDHKPIYLNLHLKPNQGTYKCCDCNETAQQLTSTSHDPVVNYYCPYKSTAFREILLECKQLQNDNKCINVHTEKEIMLKNITEVSSIGGVLNKNTPSVSINIIDSDNIYICMCAQLSNANSKMDTKDTENIDGTICSECRNIIKRQLNEHRYRLISKRLILSENIIVNRIDTHHLSTYLEYSNNDPYTPESNESHSPYPELNNSSSTTNSSNNRSSHERLLMNQDTVVKQECVHKVTKTSDECNVDQIEIAISNCDFHSKGVVSPGQLKSRLEDLQRLSMQNLNSEGDNILIAGKIDVDKVDDETHSINSATTVNIQRRKLGSKCLKQPLPESLKLLVDETLGDNIIWKEQSQVDEPGISPKVSPTARYIKIKSICNAAVDCAVENTETCRAKTKKDNVAVLKETTV